MPQQTLANRVEILERTMESLAGLPDRVASFEWQIVQFRQEVRGEFSAVREEMRALRQEAHELHEVSLTQMRVLHEDVISRIALLDGNLNRGRSRRPTGKGTGNPRSRKL